LGGRGRARAALDTAKGARPQEVSFVIGDDGKAGEFNNFKHGYAGTIYRGQGRTLDKSYVCHSALWKSSAAYVALTRHREDVQIFASHETVRGMDHARPDLDQVAATATLDPAGQAAAINARDLDIMAKGFERQENKRAATAYFLDDASAIRLHFSDLARTATGDRSQESTQEPVDWVALYRASQERRQASGSMEPGAATNQESSQGFDWAAAYEASQERRESPDELEQPSEGLAHAVEAGIESALESAANIIEGITEGLASSLEGLLGGGSAPQPRKAELPREPSKRDIDPVADYRQSQQREREARRSALKELMKLFGEDISSDEAIDIARDRGGGISR
jgi:hypothetical protein